MPDFSFPKTTHLRSRVDFERVYARKCKAADGVLLVFLDANQLALTRIGLSVSRKHGNAVTRNRLRRLLREAFRLERAQLPTGFDLVAIPLLGGDSSLETFRKSLAGLSRRLSKRLASPVVMPIVPTSDQSP